jgi:hypothetical protein
VLHSSPRESLTPLSSILGVEVTGLVPPDSSSTPSSESGSVAAFPPASFVETFKVFTFASAVFSGVFGLKARYATDDG